jgi:hypothetical protein
MTATMVAVPIAQTVQMNRMTEFVADVLQFPDERRDLLEMAVEMGANAGSDWQQIQQSVGVADPAMRQFYIEIERCFGGFVAMDKTSCSSGCLIGQLIGNRLAR